jgi:hypothetical protein
MVILYIYSTCWCMKSVFDESQQSTGGGTTQGAGYPVYLNPHLGRLSDQVWPAPHSTDSENLLKHGPPQRRELPGTDENTMEAPN